VSEEQYLERGRLAEASELVCCRRKDGSPRSTISGFRVDSFHSDVSAEDLHLASKHDKEPQWLCFERDRMLVTLLKGSNF